MEIGIIFVIVLCLWSMTKTLNKLTDKILDKQDEQYKLLEEIKSKLESSSTNIK